MLVQKCGHVSRMNDGEGPASLRVLAMFDLNKLNQWLLNKWCDQMTLNKCLMFEIQFFFCLGVKIKEKLLFYHFKMLWLLTLNPKWNETWVRSLHNIIKLKKQRQLICKQSKSYLKVVRKLLLQQNSFTIKDTPTDTQCLDTHTYTPTQTVRCGPHV